MSRNGSGTYSLPAGNPVVTGTTIQSTWANNTLSDIATALTQSLSQDGQTPVTANLPMGGFKLTGLAAGTTAGDSVRYEQFASPPAIGNTTPAAGAFTTLSASSTVSGTGFSTYLASPPAIGGTAPAAGSFTNLTTTGTVTISLTGKTVPVAADGIIIRDSAAGGVAKELTLSNLAASATPLADGTAAVGTSVLYARQDHVHPPPTLTPQNVVASRALATLYTNSTPNYIWISAWSAAFSPSVSSATLTVAGVVVNYCQLGVAGAGTAGVVTVSGWVPPGATYRVDMVAAALAGWAELR